MVMKRNVKLLGSVAMLSIALASCATDELKEVYQGEKISFTTRMTRAVETTTDNLQEFRVYADVDGYNMFINGDTARRDKSSAGNTFYTDKSYFWPSGVEKMKFWAYAPTDIVKEEQVKINFEGQKFTDFAPDNDITKQKDFVVAYNEVEWKSTSGMSVALTFKHALSQIEVKAHCPGSDNKRIYIKGAWIVNVYGKADLTFDPNSSTHLDWKFKDEIQNNSFYGTQWTVNTDDYLKVKDTDKSDANNLLTAGVDTRNLMLLPQQVSAYEFAEKEGEEDKVGGYILLLCRVEAWHTGGVHVGGTKDPLVEEGTDQHIHQLFPITEKYNKEAYGYTCVPVAFAWEAGKKYIYNLEFCGHKSGAGVYPPSLPDGLPTGDNIIKDIPEGKKNGDPVLDDPIHFEVDVEGWTGSTEDKPMQ